MNTTIPQSAPEDGKRRHRWSGIVALLLAIASLGVAIPFVPGAWWWIAYGEQGPLPSYATDELQGDVAHTRIMMGPGLTRDDTIVASNWGRAKRVSWLPGPDWIQVRQAFLFKQHMDDIQRDYVFKDGALAALIDSPPGIDGTSLAPMLDTPPGEAICFACARDGHDACTATFTADADSKYELAGRTSLLGLPSLKPGDYRCICHRTGPCARKAVRP